MTAKSTSSDELTRLLSAWADDSLTDEEFGRLDHRLRDDTHARQVYMQFVDMHEELGELSVPGFESVVGTAPLLRGRIGSLANSGTERTWRSSRQQSF
jgi:anti-sigma factor RsiW